MYTSLYPQAQRLVLLCIGAACAGMTLIYTPLEEGSVDFVLGIGGGLILCIMACKSKRMASIGAVWMGVMLCLYSLYDFPHRPVVLPRADGRWNIVGLLGNRSFAGALSGVSDRLDLGAGIAVVHVSGDARGGSPKNVTLHG